MATSNVPRVKIPASGTGEIRALVVGWDDQPLVPDDVDSVAMHLKKVTRSGLVDVDSSVYAEPSIDPADVLYTTLQPWDEDDEGYNFHHVPPNRTQIPFASPGEVYRVEYVLSPADVTKQDILIPFEVEVQ